MLPVKIDRYLRADDGLGPIAAKARAIGALEKLCTEFLPPALARQIRAVNLRDDELILLAANPAAAAKLKLLAEDLRKFLLRQGTKVSLVSVRVQPSSAQREPPAQGKTLSLSKAGISELSMLYDRLGAASPLRRALGALLEHQGVKLPPGAAPRRSRATRGRSGTPRT